MDRPWANRHREVLETILEEEKEEWHFDPARIENDYSIVGNIKDAVENWEKLVRFGYDMDLTVEKNSIFDFVRSQNKNDDTEIVHVTNLIRSMGYDQESAAQFKTYSDLYPEVFAPLADAFDLTNPDFSIIHQRPGWVCPWHYDMFNYYIRKYKVSDPRSIRRYLVFLDDWIWGHYVLVGNSIVHQWRAGDVITWPYRMRHLTANAGLTPKLTLQVTGVAG